MIEWLKEQRAVWRRSREFEHLKRRYFAAFRRACIIRLRLSDSTQQRKFAVHSNVLLEIFDHLQDARNSLRKGGAYLIASVKAESKLHHLEEALLEWERT